jgi:hypothetical protein
MSKFLLDLGGATLLRVIDLVRADLLGQGSPLLGVG